jgi:hypothetical protein
VSSQAAANFSKFGPAAKLSQYSIRKRVCRERERERERDRERGRKTKRRKMT